MSGITEARFLLRMQIVHAMEETPFPWTAEELATRTLSDVGEVVRQLVELSGTGPVVAINVHGQCCYALEWGVA